MTIITFYVRNIKKSILNRVAVALFGRCAGNNGAGCPL
jgi:hypothetical protein